MASEGGPGVERTAKECSRAEQGPAELHYLYLGRSGPPVLLPTPAPFSFGFGCREREFLVRPRDRAAVQVGVAADLLTAVTRAVFEFN
jgi:hypothetical protein